MLLHITLEKLTDSVMLPAGQVLLAQSYLIAEKNGNIWEKDDECNE